MIICFWVFFLRILIDDQDLFLLCGSRISHRAALRTITEQNIVLGSDALLVNIISILLSINLFAFDEIILVLQ